ncbi:MAG TPA: hypothetical protein VKV69_05565 [Actinomycetota bacterium]|nr:hypothetical protein [Actinomycetota bacterium]
MLVALAATACGKGGSNQGLARLDQTGFISQVAAKSVSQRTAKIEMTETVIPPSGSGAGSITLTADGVVDMANKIADIKMNFPAAMGLSGAIEMVMANKTLYMQIPAALAPQVGVSKHWLGMKLDKVVGSSPLSGGNWTDPTSVLDALRAVASSVTKGGEVTVRGVKTTQYEVTLDITKLTSKIPAFEREAISQLTFNHLNVYVSDDSLVRREEFSASVAGASITTQIDLFDFGAPVSVSVPPASQVEFKSLQDLISGK